MTVQLNAHKRTGVKPGFDIDTYVYRKTCVYCKRSSFKGFMFTVRL